MANDAENIKALEAMKGRIKTLPVIGLILSVTMAFILWGAFGAVNSAKDALNAGVNNATQVYTTGTNINVGLLAPEIVIESEKTTSAASKAGGVVDRLIDGVGAMIDAVAKGPEGANDTSVASSSTSASPDTTAAPPTMEDIPSVSKEAAHRALLVAKRHEWRAALEEATAAQKGWIDGIAVVRDGLSMPIRKTISWIVVLGAMIFFVIMTFRCFKKDYRAIAALEKEAIDKQKEIDRLNAELTAARVAGAATP